VFARQLFRAASVIELGTAIDAMNEKLDFRADGGQQTAKIAVLR
jgi:hypothetical protein